MEKLLDICDFQGGTQPPKEEWISEPRDGYVRMLQIRDFTQGDDKFIEYVFDNGKLHKCNADDIMLSRYGYIGQAFTGLAGAYNVALVKVIKKKDIKTEYLLYYFKSEYFQRHLLENVGARATIPGFNKTELKNARISIPDENQQDYIASILGRIESIMQLRKKMLHMLDNTIIARFIEMFGDPVQNEMSWPTRTLEDACKIIVDCPHSTPSYTSNNTGFMCIRTSIVKKNRIEWEKIEYISEQEYYQRIQRKRPEKGDVIYTREGAILGIAAQIDRECNVALGQRSMLLSPNMLFCTPEFLSVAMNFDSFLNYALKGISGSASPHINVGDIKAFKMIQPPIEQQRAFSAIVIQIEKTKAAVQKALDETQRLFDSLMQKYFG